MQPVSSVRSAVRAPLEAAESKWIPTACGMCYIGCGILAEVENGVVVNIEGNPDNPQNRGRMCAKGKAGVMNLYNPQPGQSPAEADQSEEGSR